MPTIIRTLAIVATIACSLALYAMHQDAVANSGNEIAVCVDRGQTAGPVYIHTFYFRPWLVAWRCLPTR